MAGIEHRATLLKYSPRSLIGHTKGCCCGPRWLCRLEDGSGQGKALASVLLQIENVAVMFSKLSSSFSYSNAESEEL